MTDAIAFQVLAAKRQYELKTRWALDSDCDKTAKTSVKQDKLQDQMESLTYAINDLSNKIKEKESKSVFTWSGFNTSDLVGRWPSVNVGVNIREKKNYYSVKLEGEVQVPKSWFVPLNMLKSIPVGYIGDGANYVAKNVGGAAVYNWMKPSS